MEASTLLLHFHNCFVQGCDGSVLLDDTPTFKGEKTTNTNANSPRGFEVIDAIKQRLETVPRCCVLCRHTYPRCSRWSSTVGGPYWDVPLGRKDSTTASLEEENNNITTPNSNIQTIIGIFFSKDCQSQIWSHSLVVQCAGGHTIGQDRCTSFRQRIYNGQNVDNELYAFELRATCPTSGGDNNISSLDEISHTLFDNSFATS